MNDEIKDLLDSTKALMEAGFDLMNAADPGCALKFKLIVNSAEDAKTILTTMKKHRVKFIPATELETNEDGDDYFVVTLAMRMVEMQKFMNAVGEKSFTAIMIPPKFTEENNAYYDKNVELLKEAMEKDKPENLVNGSGNLQ